jgi:hypothetical protein
VQSEDSERVGRALDRLLQPYVVSADPVPRPRLGAANEGEPVSGCHGHHRAVSALLDPGILARVGQCNRLYARLLTSPQRAGRSVPSPCRPTSPATSFRKSIHTLTAAAPGAACHVKPCIIVAPTTATRSSLSFGRTEERFASSACRARRACRVTGWWTGRPELLPRHRPGCPVQDGSRSSELRGARPRGRRHVRLTLTRARRCPASKSDAEGWFPYTNALRQRPKSVQRTLFYGLGRGHRLDVINLMADRRARSGSHFSLDGRADSSGVVGTDPFRSCWSGPADIIWRLVAERIQFDGPEARHVDLAGQRKLIGSGSARREHGGNLTVDCAEIGPQTL